METLDSFYMERAVALAGRGIGHVNPNPLVGAVIVKDGQVIGEGWHERFGGLHAERNALADCKADPCGATMYVTLEPCCHYGKTPPCTEAIVGSGISRVVVGMEDPNQLVAGKGMQLLRDAGIEVVCGVCGDKVRFQNRIFIKYITSRRPWVVLKTAMTLDGKIAAVTGDSKWVTGEKARRMVHELRNGLMAVMVGKGTVLSDDPMLDCRLGDPSVRQPVRVVVDSRAEIPLESRLVRTACEVPLVLAHASGASAEKLDALRAAGVRTVQCGGADGRVDAGMLLDWLGADGIDSVMLEGGGELAWSFVRDRLVDEVYAFISPKIVGGAGAKTPVCGDGFGMMGDAMPLSDVRVERIGEDILVTGRMQRNG